MHERKPSRFRHKVIYVLHQGRIAYISDAGRCIQISVGSKRYNIIVSISNEINILRGGVDGILVSIVDFQALDLGSIPGRRKTVKDILIHLSCNCYFITFSFYPHRKYNQLIIPKKRKRKLIYVLNRSCLN